MTSVHAAETSAVPMDDFTPYGYLHVPGHTRNLSVKGVVRSHQVGYRFHVPAFAGMYGGRRETYRAGMSLAVDGCVVLPEFDDVTSPIHTKNRSVFEVRHGNAVARSEWNLVGDDVLMMSLDARDHGELAILIEYQRIVSANGEWGESGLVGRVDNGNVVIQSFEDGDAFIFSSTVPTAKVAFTQELEQATGWIADLSSMPGTEPGQWANALGSRGDTVQLYAVVTLETRDDTKADMFLSRGMTQAQAEERLAHATEIADAERSQKQREDETFWQSAPALTGDWPDHWRRGLVYDFETLRMMVMKPIGIYEHIWDGMQIQAPRMVLGEAAIDALLLSYADPAIAQELLFGVFEDAPEPNVPCSREDGTYNMVSARGEVCGTGPQWGYPWLVLDWLWTLRPDKRWLERMYPRLDAYLDWWLMHRSHDDGWLWFECSWESGQDGTPRLGDQPLGGGHPTPHVRPVDLHASMSHAARVMSQFADALGLQHDIDKWVALADDYARRTRELWNGERFADFDIHTNAFTDIVDVMQYSAIQFDLADNTQVEKERAAIRDVDPKRLTWPMFAWTVADAATKAGEPGHAVAVAADICDRAWGYWDARVHEDGKTMPGITCEYWPLSGRCGGEGYGWGAFGVHLFFHTILGYEPGPSGLVIAPNLPPELRVPGKRYGVRLAYGNRSHTIEIAPGEGDALIVTIDGTEHDVAWGDRISLGQRESQGG